MFLCYKIEASLHFIDCTHTTRLFRISGGTARNWWGWGIGLEQERVTAMGYAALQSIEIRDQNEPIHVIIIR